MATRVVPSRMSSFNAASSVQCGVLSINQCVHLRSGSAPASPSGGNQAGGRRGAPLSALRQRRFGSRRTGSPGSSRPTRPSCSKAVRASGCTGPHTSRRPPALAKSCKSLIRICRGARGRTHPDGHQPPQPDQGHPATLPRHRHQVLGQLSEVVSSRRPRQPSIVKSLPRSRQRQNMPAIRKLSQFLVMVAGIALPGCGRSVSCGTEPLNARFRG